MERLKQLILDYDFDVVGLTEVNKDWRLMNYNETIWGATEGWKENRRILMTFCSELQTKGRILENLDDGPILP